MIAHCSSCGTHYKHDPPGEGVRARCGRCDAELSLRRLSSYRIVSMRHARSTVPSAPGGTAVLTAPPDDLWRQAAPPSDAYASSPSQAEDGALLQDTGAAASGTEPSIGGSSATFALWLAAGAIAGTAVSWTMNGGTAMGMIAGSALGALAGWGWLRWTSPK